MHAWPSATTGLLVIEALKCSRHLTSSADFLVSSLSSDLQPQPFCFLHLSGALGLSLFPLFTFHEKDIYGYRVVQMVTLGVLWKLLTVAESNFLHMGRRG